MECGEDIRMVKSLPIGYRERIFMKNNRALTTFVAVLFAMILVLFMRTLFFRTVVVAGASMQPTLRAGDRLLATRGRNLPEDLKGRIVLVRTSAYPDAEFVKRVVATPGMTVEIKDGGLYLNGVREEGSADLETYNDRDHWELGADEYFVLGDNHAHLESEDSRVFGPVRRSEIEGVVFFRFYPLSRIGAGDVK